MNSFQIIVLSIFVILAILILTAFTIMLTSKKDEDSEYPTTYSACPDYWDVSGNTCVMHSSINNGSGWQSNYDSSTKSGKTPGYDDSTASKIKVDFKNADWNDGIYPGVSGRCALKQWANTYNIVWDGVNNYNSAYC
jgi:hypothetical protein